MRASRAGDAVESKLWNRTGTAVRAALEFRLRGGERRDTVRTSGSAVQRVPFDLPAWATGLEVDVAMSRDQWGRFTDFGVTVRDSAGRQLAQDPMEYAFGRLSTTVAAGRSGTRAEVALAPGFADPADGGPWEVVTTIRLYADSAVDVQRAAAGGEVTLAAGAQGSMRFQLPSMPWALPSGFAPMGVVLAREGERVWTLEGGYPERSAAR